MSFTKWRGGGGGRLFTRQRPGVVMTKNSILYEASKQINESFGRTISGVWYLMHGSSNK